MKALKFSKGSAAAFAAAALLSAAPASAALSDAAEECRTRIAKPYIKMATTAVKTIGGCHKSRDKGDAALAAVDCNVVTSPSVDSKGKFSGSAAKFEETFDTYCTDDLVGSELLDPDFYQLCPVPCAGVMGAMDTMGEVGECIICNVAAQIGEAATTTLGMPTPPLSSTDSKCHAAVTKGWGKYLGTALKDETTCQAGQDALDMESLAACTNTPASDPKGKTAGALSKANAGIDKACATAVLANLDGCAADTSPNYRTCTQAAWTDAEDDVFAGLYELATTACPVTIRTTIFGGCSVEGGTVSGNCSEGNQTGTSLSVGWKGLAHGVDITDGYQLAGDITCPGPESGSCGDCVINGISTDSEQYQSFLRCKDATFTECDTPFGNDPDCPSGGACRYFLGPPLAISAGGTPTCTVNVVDQDITGTVDPDAGSSAFTVNLRSVVHTGASQVQPCPVCRGDDTAKDGLKQGVCAGGSRNGQICDVQAFDLNFATDIADDTPFDGPSLDCPPPSGANISGAGLAVNLALTTGTSTKSAQDACDSPNESLNCFCGVCSHNGTVSCNTDAECDALDGGLPGSSVCGFGGGVERKPNNCSDGICTPETSDRGVCAGSDIPPVDPDLDTYCDGVRMTNGKGIIPCVTTADCDTYDSICPDGECGTCGLFQLRSCFLDPIEISGTPSTTNPILAGTFCLPPSSNGSVNLATGSPGPGVVQTDTVIELRY